jgi:hypothetical protein
MHIYYQEREIIRGLMDLEDFVERLDESGPDSTLYHYTDLSGLVNILYSGETKKELSNIKPDKSATKKGITAKPISDGTIKSPGGEGFTKFALDCAEYTRMPYPTSQGQTSLLPGTSPTYSSSTFAKWDKIIPGK